MLGIPKEGVPHDRTNVAGDRLERLGSSNGF
jgi:hypothetical protein